jgi:hypothetical protein
MKLVGDRGKRMLVVKDVGRRLIDGSAELYATVDSGRKALPAQTAWFRYPESYFDRLCPTSDAFLAAMLMPAMRLGLPLRIEGVVSEKLLAGAHRFMEILNGWLREYRPVPITADEVRPSQASGREVASFFSGGIDSFYTVLKWSRPDVPPGHRITRLLFVHGFDISRRNEDLYRMVHGHIASAADALGLELICLSTNIKEVARRVSHWTWYHGAALGAVSLGLEGAICRVYLPAAFAADMLHPHGSHPLTDPLWGTETLEIVHEGYQLTRPEKVFAEIARSEVALTHLRVCFENRGGRYNCGVCEKCLRTKVNLAVAGVLDQCETFDGKLDYETVARFPITDLGARLFVEESINAAVAHGGDPQLIEALQRSLTLRARLSPRCWPLYIKQATRTVRRRLLGGLFEKASWQMSRRA